MKTIIIGGGIAGLTTAWRASAHSEVHLFDGNPARAASLVAGGMLAPVSEVSFTEEPLLRLDLVARQQWPAFAQELETFTGLAIGFRTEGTVHVGFNDDDLRELERLREFQLELGLNVSPLTADEIREREPHLSPRVVGGTWVESDFSVDNRALVAALRVACEKAGVIFHAHDVESLALEGRTAIGVHTHTGVESADRVVIANGSWSGLLADVIDVRPVKGEIIRVQTPPSFGAVITHTVRAIIRGVPIYLVPRTHGEIVIGATQLETGFSTTPTVMGVYQLLRDARELLPVLSEMEIVDICAGLRPGTPDNAPLLGLVPGYDNLLVASGHYRNGILLSSISGDVMAAYLHGDDVPQYARPFSPDRSLTRMAMQ